MPPNEVSGFRPGSGLHPNMVWAEIGEERSRLLMGVLLRSVPGTWGMLTGRLRPVISVTDDSKIIEYYH